MANMTMGGIYFQSIGENCDIYSYLNNENVDDPRYTKGQTNKALGKYMSLHPHNWHKKRRIYYRTLPLVPGAAPHRRQSKETMLVTGSRLHAVRYYFEFIKYIKNGYTDLVFGDIFLARLKDNVTLAKLGREENIKHCPPKVNAKFECGEISLLLVCGEIPNWLTITTSAHVVLLKTVRA